MSKPDNAALAVLQGELEQDLAALPSLVDENRRAVARIEAGACDSLDYAALGYTIHNLYCLMENTFFRIAKTFENNLGDAGWHRELLERMLAAVPGIRPAILRAGLRGLRKSRFRFHGDPRSRGEMTFKGTCI
jgi:hypothetical protein